MLLQYIIKGDSVEDIKTQARAALDAGLNWIEIKAGENVADAQLGKLIEELRPEMADKNCVLILAARIDAAKDFKADGVHVYSMDRPVSAARVALDAWPIIGVSVDSREAAEALHGYDIDYLFLDRRPDDDTAVVSQIAAYLNEKDIETPLVAAGARNAADAARLAEAGADAVAIGKEIAADGEDLKTAIERMKTETDKL